MQLTDLTALKLRLYPEGNAPSTYDALLTDLIADVSAWIESARGAPFDEAEYDHYLDGDGSYFLRLPAGPLKEVESVATVAYSVDGAGARVLTDTAVGEGSFLPRGLLSDNHTGLGWLERIDGSAWTNGQRNVHVVYTAGWATVPAAVKRVATNEVRAEFAGNNAGSGVYSSISLGDYRVAFTPTEERTKAMLAALGPYMNQGFGFGR